MGRLTAGLLILLASVDGAVAGRIVTEGGRIHELSQPPEAWSDVVLVRIGGTVIAAPPSWIDIPATRAEISDANMSWAAALDEIAVLQAAAPIAAQAPARDFCVLGGAAELRVDAGPAAPTITLLTEGTFVEIASNARLSEPGGVHLRTRHGLSGWMAARRVDDVLHPEHPLPSTEAADRPRSLLGQPPEASPALREPVPPDPSEGASSEGWAPDLSTPPSGTAAGAHDAKPAVAAEPARGDWTPELASPAEAEAVSIVPPDANSDHPIRKRNFKARGAKVGAIIGGVLGGLFGGDAQSVAIGAAAGAAIGLGIGAAKDRAVRNHVDTANAYGWDPSRGPMIVIEKFETTPTVRPGESLDVRIQYVALSSPKSKVKVGTVVGVFDGTRNIVERDAATVSAVPGSGGGTYERSFTLTIPADTPPGEYELVTRLGILEGNEPAADAVARTPIQVSG